RPGGSSRPSGRADVMASSPAARRAVATPGCRSGNQPLDHPQTGADATHRAGGIPAGGQGLAAENLAVPAVLSTSTGGACPAPTGGDRPVTTAPAPPPGW